MGGFYSSLVARLGEDGARQYMRDMRDKVKNPKGLQNFSPEKRREVATMGGRARWNKNHVKGNKTKESSQPSPDDMEIRRKVRELREKEQRGEA